MFLLRLVKNGFNVAINWKDGSFDFYEDTYGLELNEKKLNN